MERTQVEKLLSDCRLCPRECGVNRLAGQRGRCGQTAELTAARAALHFWEEPCISGEEGSGAVFFSGCPVGCVYCQNQPIARGRAGKGLTVPRLAEIFLELQEKGANNINLVTPTHFVPQITEALDLARPMGLRLPVVYNTSGYEKEETIRLLEGYVDIYLTDFKYMDPVLSERYSDAPDYPVQAKKALAEMVHMTGTAQFDQRGRMTKGVIVRHLALPGQGRDSKAVIRYLYETYGDKIWLSILNQYTPLPHAVRYPELSRSLRQEDYEELVDFALELGVEQGFIQEGETVSESFIPAFDNEGI